MSGEIKSNAFNAKNELPLAHCNRLNKTAATPNQLTRVAQQERISKQTGMNRTTGRVSGRLRKQLASPDRINKQVVA